jgi:hypothetical protein
MVDAADLERTGWCGEIDPVLGKNEKLKPPIEMSPKLCTENVN